MDESCPYCGKETGALKNHVRLASGDGHGPNGSYPDDFFQAPEAGGSGAEASKAGQDGAAETADGAAPEPDPGSDGGDGAGSGLDPAGVDAAIDAARQEGYRDGTEDGFEAGYTTAEHELAAETCPECGGQLDTDVAGVGWIRHDGAVAELEEAESLCRSCDLLIPETGDPIKGSHYGGEPDLDAGGGGVVSAAGTVILGLVGAAVVAIKGNSQGTNSRPGRRL